MMKALKFVIATICIISIFILGVIVYIFTLTKGVDIDENKFVNFERVVSFYDDENLLLSEQAGGTEITEFCDIPNITKKAFIAIEDKRFYLHNGVDYRSLIRATLNNVKSFSFKEGASTITQQLIKNTHLTNEKTLKRKVLEIKLSRDLEKIYSKDEILEKYLNTIYFGDGCYGITAAAKRYFNKQTNQLNLTESAILAGLIKAPSIYSPTANVEKCNLRKNVVLYQMLKQGYITESEYEESAKYKICNTQFNQVENYSFLDMVRSEAEKIIGESPYSKSNLKVYTTINSKLQKLVDDKLNDYDCFKCDKTIILMNVSGKILAYSSTVGDVKRQLGSIIKPVLVYAPAINENLVSSYTIINDEKTDFNGYCPSNYMDDYCGYTSVKQSLVKSSNVCAVKLLNSLGVDKALKYSKITDLQFTDNDKSLALALGASEYGNRLSEITSAYCAFANGGYYNSPTAINEIKEKNGYTLHKSNKKCKKFIESDSATIINDMLLQTVKIGTAKKLSALNFDVYAKTGTAGQKSGNTDAYTISYNGDYVLGVWLGGKDGKLLDNKISGGTIPAQISLEIWNQLYDGIALPKSLLNNENVLEISLDKISYEQERKIVLADEVSPKRYVLKVLSRKSNLPKEISTRFSKPKIKTPKISVYNNGIKIELCQTEYIDIMLYRKSNGKKELIYNSNGKWQNFYIDNSVVSNSVYEYTALPYYKNNGTIYTGNEINLGKIKLPSNQLGNDWWLNEFL